MIQSESEEQNKYPYLRPEIKFSLYQDFSDKYILLHSNMYDLSTAEDSVLHKENLMLHSLGNPHPSLCNSGSSRQAMKIAAQVLFGAQRKSLLVRLHGNRK